MKHLLRLSYFVLSILCGLPAFAADPFSIEIVPSTSHADGRFGGRIVTMGDKAHRFEVVLQNTSKEAQAVFEEASSLGYRNISFEFTLADGKKLMVSRKEERFVGNDALTFVVAPDAFYVRPIALDGKWETKPEKMVYKMPYGENLAVTVKAIYEVKESEETKKNKVWVGRVESKPYQFTLRHWK